MERYYYKKDGKAAYNLKEPIENVLEDVTGYELITEEEWNALLPKPKTPTAEELELRRKQNRIAELKKLLADTDYVALKLAEAIAKGTSEAILTEYAEVFTNRDAWRAEINELEAE